MTSQQIIFTILIPHYNIPELLIRCLNSIPDKEYIQVIVIDDCSPCQKDVFIMLESLNRKNIEWYSTLFGGSAGRARNVGLEKAKGKWLIFIDSDDYFVDNFIDILYQIKKQNADLLLFRTKSVKSDNITELSGRNFYDYLFTEYFTNQDDRKLRYCYHPLWGKIFKRKFIQENNIRFDETKYSNDYFFSFAAGAKAKEVFVSNNVLYIVTEREGSLASFQFSDSPISKEECIIRFKVSLKVREFAKKNKLPVIPTDMFNYLLSLRKYYKCQYIITLFKMLPSHPSVIKIEIQSYLNDKLRQFYITSNK